MPRQCSAQAAISGVRNALFFETHSEFSLASLSLKPRERLTGISDRAQYLTRYGYSEWPDSFIEPYRGTSHLRRINADAPEKLWYDTARAAFFYKRASYEFERVSIRQGKPVRKPGSRRFRKTQRGGLKWIRSAEALDRKGIARVDPLRLVAREQDELWFQLQFRNSIKESFAVTLVSQESL